MRWHCILHSAVVVSMAVGPTAARAQFRGGAMRGSMMMGPLMQPVRMNMGTMRPATAMTRPGTTMLPLRPFITPFRFPFGATMTSVPLIGFSPYGSVNPYGGYAGSASAGGYFQGGSGSPSGRGVYGDWLTARDRGQRPEEREQAERDLLERALNDPADADVISGAALNRIVDALRSEGRRSRTIPAVPLPEGVLPQLRMTTPGGGSPRAEVIGRGGKVRWPAVLLDLSDPQAAAVRSAIEGRLAEASAPDADGRASAVRTRQLAALTGRLDELVTADARALGFERHREAKRFVKGLDEVVAALAAPGAAGRLPADDGLTATSVQELVRELDEKRLRFAAAPPGSEPAYRATHRALAECYRTMARDVARR